MAVESYSLYYIRQTEKAVCLQETPNDQTVPTQSSMWFPKSQIEIDDDFENLVSGQQIDVYIPDWLAEDKGLL